MAFEFDPSNVTPEGVAKLVGERFSKIEGLQEKLNASMEQLGQVVEQIHAGIGGRTNQR